METIRSVENIKSLQAGGGNLGADVSEMIEEIDALTRLLCGRAKEGGAAWMSRHNGCVWLRVGGAGIIGRLCRQSPSQVMFDQQVGVSQCRSGEMSLIWRIQVIGWFGHLRLQVKWVSIWSKFVRMFA